MFNLGGPACTARLLLHAGRPAVLAPASDGGRDGSPNPWDGLGPPSARHRRGIVRPPQRAARNVRAAAARRTAVRAAASTDLVSELNNIDFRKMIGGPLQAAVDAQVASSLAAVDFINKVRVAEDAQGKKELVMVDFTHKRHNGPKADGSGDNIKDVAIQVPLLAMLPIPSLRP